MSYKILYISLLFLIIEKKSFSQEYSGLNYDETYMYENLLQSSQPDFHTSIKPLLLSEFQNSKLLDSVYYKKNKTKFFDHILNKDLAGINKERFNLSINPIINLYYDKKMTESGKDSISHFNSYGLSAKLGIAGQFSFCGNFQFNDAIFPGYINSNIRRTKIIPHFGRLQEDQFSGRGSDSGRYQFIIFTGYLSFNLGQNINLQTGIDKNFIGEGYRSLFLSDNANAYPFLKLTLDLKRLKYQALFSALRDINSDKNTFDLYDKYSASHYFSINLTKRINLGLFETVIWRGGDSAGYRGFDVNYLNPVTIYRPVEYNLGSPDNVLLGLSTSIRLFRLVKIYSQILLDEFNLTELKKDKTWWGNKIGYQAGLKCFNLFKIKNLFFETEFNYVRPYTYSHINSLENYGNFAQPLAHPLGANFKETIFLFRYSVKRFSFSVIQIFSTYGEDTSNFDFGRNIYISYNNRVGNYGISSIQGLLTDKQYSEFRFSYLLNYKYGLVAECGYRSRFVKNKNYAVRDEFVFLGLRTSLYNYFWE